MMYRIIENNADFLVVCKSQGVCIHTENEQRGLIAELKNDMGYSSLYPVHRLDKVTSGLVLCAKHQRAASELSQLFQHRQIEKYYLAVSHKKPKKKQGLIVGDMARARRGAWKLCHSKNNPAITQFFSYGVTANDRLFVVKPHTGKTHQIRVALKSVGSPIVGDAAYGFLGEKTEGIFLHAYALMFTYQEKIYQFSSLPVHWGSVMTEYIKASSIVSPWELKWPTLPVFR